MAYLRLTLAMLFYGISFISTRVVLTALGPISIITVRLAISALFLITLDALLPGGERADRWPRARELPAILLVIFFQPVLYFLAENTGMQTVTASIASIIIGTIPVFTPLFARLLLHDRFPALGYAGVLVSLLGVLIIILDGRTSAQYTPGGLVLIFVAVLAAVGYTLSLRFLAPRYRPLSIAKFQSLFAFPLIFSLGLLVEGVPTRVPAPDVLAHLVYLGVFPSSLAFVFLNRGVRELGPSRANVFVNLVPVFTAIVSWIYLGEQFTPAKIAGMAVVIVGVITVQRARSSLTAGGSSPTITS